jgi:gentisate 1,2-dioxygenase
MRHGRDLILTPKLTWHDHSNESAAPMIWLDGLTFRWSPLCTVMQGAIPNAANRPKSSEQAGQSRQALRHGLPLTDPFHFKRRDTEKRCAA